MTNSTPVIDAIIAIKDELGIPTTLKHGTEQICTSDRQKTVVEFIEPDIAAARTMNRLLDDLCKAAQISTQINQIEPDGDTEGRKIFFVIPTSQIPLLAEVLETTRQRFHEHPAVTAQYNDARTLIEEGIDRDKIEGVYAYISIKMNEDKPYAVLNLRNVPKRLARALADMTGQDFDELADGGETPNHDYTRMLTGGKDIRLRMDHPNIGDVRVALMNYQEHAALSHDPEAHLTPGRRLDQRQGGDIAR